jgi:hypothetical protein
MALFFCNSLLRLFPFYYNNKKRKDFFFPFTIEELFCQVIYFTILSSPLIGNWRKKMRSNKRLSVFYPMMITRFYKLQSIDCVCIASQFNRQQLCCSFLSFHIYIFKKRERNNWRRGGWRERELVSVHYLPHL